VCLRRLDVGLEFVEGSIGTVRRRTNITSPYQDLPSRKIAQVFDGDDAIETRRRLTPQNPADRALVDAEGISEKFLCMHLWGSIHRLLNRPSDRHARR
jgi:hypothetical protein